MKIFSTRLKKNTRAVTFQPGNKESITAVDSASAARQAIPSFLIMSAKVILEEYVMADINENVISRYDFLNQWNRLFSAAFRACHIYVGFEKSGLMPLNPELILGPLRHIVQEKEEPLLPQFLQRNAVTPRKAKKSLDQIRDKLHILSSSTRAVISHAEAALDYSIITQSVHKKTLTLQREWMKLEGRRTRRRRQIPVADGAFTLKELREKVDSRSHEEQNALSRREARMQRELFRTLRADEALRKDDVPRPRPRGRAAVIAKAAQVAAEAAQLQEMRDSYQMPEEAEAIAALSQEWKEADEERRAFLWSIHPLPNLTAIPEVVAWKEAQDAKSADKGDEADELDEDFNYDYISVSSSISLPPLPFTDDSDSDAIKIITTARIETTTRRIYNIQHAPVNEETAEEEEAPRQARNAEPLQIRGFVREAVTRKVHPELRSAAAKLPCHGRGSVNDRCTHRTMTTPTLEGNDPIWNMY
ncbi:hypothetical protein EDB81DRAFT_767279 [Dactylonectria macrodidyma]|uniref:Uncharacterized protein n=1 Tax=Dactylonectria macrodidyma TaxID=307937 RepID=A0A9P9IFH9_9HYPO|nr:hypothetical protein EDB81DRAFT_767279 [Dactylonectria macrodidyma]